MLECLFTECLKACISSCLDIQSVLAGGDCFGLHIAMPQQGERQQQPKPGIHSPGAQAVFRIRRQWLF